MTQIQGVELDGLDKMMREFALEVRIAKVEHFRQVAVTEQADGRCLFRGTLREAEAWCRGFIAGIGRR